MSKLTDAARKAPETARELVRKAPGVARELRHRLDELRGKRAASAAAPVPAPPPPVEEPPRKPKAKNWELSSQAELVAHIEGHYHAGLRRDLPALVALAQKLDRVRAAEPSIPDELYAAITSFASSLDGHMYQEETKLFPVMRTGARGGELDMPIRMMERDHDSHADELERIRALAGEPPASAPAVWSELCAALAALEADLRQHVYLENNVLFARALGDRA